MLCAVEVLLQEGVWRGFSFVTGFVKVLTEGDQMDGKAVQLFVTMADVKPFSGFGMGIDSGFGGSKAKFCQKRFYP